MLLAISCLSGCAPKHPATAPVRGVVAYGGGPWPKAGALFFTVVEPGSQLPRRPGIARFDTDGNFAVTTWRDADGLMPGKYRVGVECWKIPPVMGGPPPVSYVPASYQNPATSGIELVIAPDDAAKSLQLNIPPASSKER